MTVVPVRPSMAARLWPVGLIGVLLITVLANLYVLRLAGADRSFTIEPDYYAKALKWDEHQAQLAANARLGWHFDIDASAPGAIRVAARDAAGAKLDGLALQISGSANRTGDLLESVTLQPLGGGQYAAAMPLVGGGLWRLTLTADHGASHYALTEDIDAGQRP